MSKFESSKRVISYWNHIWQSKFVLLVMLNISQIPQKLYLAERFVQKVVTNTAWNVSKYGVISGPYVPVFGLNTRK